MEQIKTWPAGLSAALAALLLAGTVQAAPAAGESSQRIPAGLRVSQILADGRHLVLSQALREVKPPWGNWRLTVWDTETGKVARAVTLPWAPRNSYGLSPRVTADGKWVVRWVDDQVEVYDVSAESPAGPAARARRPRGSQSWTYHASSSTLALIGRQHGKRAKSELILYQLPGLKRLRVVKNPGRVAPSRITFNAAGEVVIGGRRYTRAGGYTRGPSYLVRVGRRGRPRVTRLPKDTIFGGVNSAGQEFTAGHGTMELSQPGGAKVRFDTRGCYRKHFAPAGRVMVCEESSDYGAYVVYDMKTGRRLAMLQRRPKEKAVLGSTAGGPRLIIQTRGQARLRLYNLGGYLAQGGAPIDTRGTCTGDCWRGQGTLVKGKEVRKGHFHRGELSKGSWRKTDGSLEEGSFSGGKLLSGTRTLRDGRKISGVFRGSSCPTRFGTIVYPDGRSYDGKVERCRPHGTGKMTRRDGTVFSGKWANGQGEGFMVRRSKAGKVLESGYYRAGKLLPPPQRVRRRVASRSKKRRPYKRSWITCYQCGGRGYVATRAITEKRNPTSLIMAGDKRYGGRYTHYEHKPTTLRPARTVVVKPAGARRCGYCKGRGQVVK